MAKILSIFQRKRFGLLTVVKTGYDGDKREDNFHRKNNLRLADREHLKQLFGVKNGVN